MSKQSNAPLGESNISTKDKEGIEIISIYSDNGKTLQEILEEIVKITIN
ncbi:hypothetical protein [Alkaliphilus transvaalensis]|nr:hypothetical protein [Alkaliphilus transvaalensis]